MWRKSTIFIQDECGFMRVFAKDHMADNLVTHEPFAFPKDVNQVFVVPDRLNSHWLIMVDTEVRRYRPEIGNAASPTLATDEEEELEGEGFENNFVIHTNSDTEDAQVDSIERQDEVYEEEIITYRRRQTQSQTHPIISENVFSSGITLEEFSDDERAPDDEDFPIIQV